MKNEDEEETGAAASQEEASVDNSVTVITKIAKLYAERLMSDVVLVVGKTEYPSHRLILCASSEVFACMLMNPNWTESQETKVQLCETPSCEAVFEDFLKVFILSKGFKRKLYYILNASQCRLQYLYTGKISLDYATVIPIVSLADKYNVRDLLRIGLDYMTRNVSTACKRNQVSVRSQPPRTNFRLLLRTFDLFTGRLVVPVHGRGRPHGGGEAVRGLHQGQLSSSHL